MRRPLPQFGFSLMEVLVAISIMAIIATLAGQALHTATTSGAVTDDAVKRMASIDRTWVLLDTDLRNSLPRLIAPPSGEIIPAMTAGSSGGYWLTLLRGGVANPLHLTRSEVVRVGYRLEDGTLWRDMWQDTGTSDARKAVSQILMTDVKNMRVRVLADTATSIAAGPWLPDWPTDGDKAKLPRAIEFTLHAEDFGEIKRLFNILPGENAVFVARPLVPGGVPGPTPVQPVNDTGGAREDR